MLREVGYDVLSIQESFAGTPDVGVLELAASYGRLLLTFDRDFGDQIFRKGVQCPNGVVYLRLKPSYPREPAEILLPVLDEFTLLQKFTVITRHSIRQREIPNVFN